MQSWLPYATSRVLSAVNFTSCEPRPKVSTWGEERTNTCYKLGTTHRSRHSTRDRRSSHARTGTPKGCVPTNILGDSTIGVVRNVKYKLLHPPRPSANYVDYTYPCGLRRFGAVKCRAFVLPPKFHQCQMTLAGKKRQGLADTKASRVLKSWRTNDRTNTRPRPAARCDRCLRGNGGQTRQQHQHVHESATHAVPSAPPSSLRMQLRSDAIDGTSSTAVHHPSWLFSQTQRHQVPPTGRHTTRAKKKRHTRGGRATPQNVNSLRVPRRRWHAPPPATKTRSPDLQEGSARRQRRTPVARCASTL